jgi:hypothetical protein
LDEGANEKLGFFYDTNLCRTLPIMIDLHVVIHFETESDENALAKPLPVISDAGVLNCLVR